MGFFGLCCYLKKTDAISTTNIALRASLLAFLHLLFLSLNVSLLDWTIVINFCGDIGLKFVWLLILKSIKFELVSLNISTLSMKFLMCFLDFRHSKLPTGALHKSTLFWFSINH